VRSQAGPRKIAAPTTAAAAATLDRCCEVWWADATVERPWHLDVLDATERSRRERLKFAADRARFTIAATLLRLVTARQLATSASLIVVDRTCLVCRQPHGRPRIKGGDLYVSVSHSDAWVAVAVTRVADVGVDVERVSEHGVEALSPSVLSGSEMTEVGGAADFFKFWTRKEALVKATGDGLTVPMTQVVVTGTGACPRLLAYPGRPGLAARLHDLCSHAGYAAALAVLTAEPLDIVELSADGLLDNGR
jgi:4'-phosphopantetheinyl transferase